MFRKRLLLSVVLMCLAGCAAISDPTSSSQIPWHDEIFAYDGKLVTVTKEDLFRLDPELMQKLNDPAVQELSTPQRLEFLLGLLYGQEMKSFPYARGQSSIATETWRQKQGDCLSLTVLAFSMAHQMKMTAQMQEVKVGVLFDRREGLDFLSEHVNVLLRRSGQLRWSEGRLEPADMIIDFEPQVSSNREGQALSDNAILARFYNNIAVEHFVNGNHILAYAHFKAAILADPGFPPSYSNLALLYQRTALLADAEQLLRLAVRLSDANVIPLTALYQLMLAQGRQKDAAHYARLLQSKREQDPYHLIDLGIKHLNDGEIYEAITALRQAQRRTNGFEEVHRYLAEAYLRAGDQDQANEQLGLLATLNRESPDRAVSLKKMATP